MLLLSPEKQDLSCLQGLSLQAQRNQVRNYRSISHIGFCKSYIKLHKIGRWANEIFDRSKQNVPLMLINVLVNIICILGEALPVVNVTQLEKDTIVNKCTGQYYLYFR
jgi:hypothetical protein